VHQLRWSRISRLPVTFGPFRFKQLPCAELNLTAPIVDSPHPAFSLSLPSSHNRPPTPLPKAPFLPPITIWPARHHPHVSGGFRVRASNWPNVHLPLNSTAAIPRRTLLRGQVRAFRDFGETDKIAYQFQLYFLPLPPLLDWYVKGADDTFHTVSDHLSQTDVISSSKAIPAGLAILLGVCALLQFVYRYSYDVQVNQGG
jgi:hypothetical protein